MVLRDTTTTINTPAPSNNEEYYLDEIPTTLYSNYLALSAGGNQTNVKEYAESNYHNGHFEESYSYGINFLLGRKLFLKNSYLYSGLSFQKVQLIEEINEIDIDNTTNEFESAFGLFDFIGEEEDEKELLIKHSNYYIEVPIGINYSILNTNKFVVNINSNLSFGYSLKSKNKYPYELRETSTNILSKKSLTYFVSIPFEYKVKKKLSLFVEPFYKSYLSSITTSKTLLVKPKMYGLNFGFKTFF